MKNPAFEGIFEKAKKEQLDFSKGTNFGDSIAGLGVKTLESSFKPPNQEELDRSELFMKNIRESREKTEMSEEIDLFKILRDNLVAKRTEQEQKNLKDFVEYLNSMLQNKIENAYLPRLYITDLKYINLLKKFKKNFEDAGFIINHEAEADTTTYSIEFKE